MVSAAAFVSGIAVLASAATLVVAQEGQSTGAKPAAPVSYACDLNVCKAPACFCASTKPPGGLDPKTIPMFVTLTFDDAVNSVVWPIIQNFTEGWNPNPNGCPHSSTFFVSNRYTDYRYVSYLYSMGHEIGVHTVNHVENAPAAEIQASQQAINAFAGVPMNQLVGFRHPFLAYNGASFNGLAGLGTFLYDSSMPEDSKTSNFWPYTLDNGPAVGCVSGTCDGPFRYPGLWEIPMNTLLNADGTENSPMDPNPVPGGAAGEPTAAEIFELLKANFLRRYNGDRAPMGIFIHAATQIAVPARTAGFLQFFKWTQDTYPNDVYYVNNQQLLSWMLNPTDLATSKGSPTLGCRLPAIDPSNPEICDGINNKVRGDVPTADVGMIDSCAFPPDAYWSTCYGCPNKSPNITEAVPTRTGTRALVPAAGCGAGVWDPVGAKCVTVSRPGSAPTPAANLPIPAGPGKFQPGTAPVIPPPAPPTASATPGTPDNGTSGNRAVNGTKASSDSFVNSPVTSAFSTLFAAVVAAFAALGL
ncbi:hypothetical protein HDU86_003575 [Geranomyces michiganensis]|nr:hypothetical protein HDU86_003575 [Geranomyces michiganensis]